jgi:Zn-finger nucleic acid-binding protein
MKCTKCASPFQTLSVAGLEIERCSGCQGLWFDEFELAELREAQAAREVETGTSAPAAAAHSGPLHCPKCQGRLLRMSDLRQPQVVYETCSICRGVFLDAGEFADLQEQTLVETFRDIFSLTRRASPRPHHALSAMDLHRILRP